MTEEERIVAAGEYVLGTLSGPERAAFAARIAGDRTCAGAVRFWERALGPLAGTTAEVAPPPAVWARIEARTQGVAGVANDRASGWRAAALGLGALAAALGAFVLVRPAPRPLPAPPLVASAPAVNQFVSSVTATGTQTALLLTIDPASGTVVAHPVQLSAPAQRSLELWWIAAGSAPQSVGLIDPGRPLRARIGANMRLEGGTFAVSLEPLGGSRSAGPTGPVLYSGPVTRLGRS